MNSLDIATIMVLGIALFSAIGVTIHDSRSKQRKRKEYLNNG